MGLADKVGGRLELGIRINKKIFMKPSEESQRKQVYFGVGASLIEEEGGRKWDLASKQNKFLG